MDTTNAAVYNITINLCFYKFNVCNCLLTLKLKKLYLLIF